MAQQFCTHCGASIADANQRFCTNCGNVLNAAHGAPASQPAPAPATRPSGGVAPGMATGADTSGVDRMANDIGTYAPSMPQTTAMPAVPPQTPYQAPQTSPMYVAPAPAQGPAQRASLNAGMIAAIVAAVVIVAAAIVLAVLHPWDGGGSSVPTPSSSSSVPSPSPSSSASAPTPSSSQSGSSASSSQVPSSSSAADSTAAQEAAVYEALVAAYDRMGNYNARISDAAGTFNSSYLSGSVSERRSNSNEAKALREEISGYMNSIKALSVPSSSKYRQSHETIMQLQQDLYNRINVICQAWDNSLRYDNPQDHSSEILAPIAKDNDANGVNIYKKDFDAVYPGARPVA